MKKIEFRDNRICIGEVEVFFTEKIDQVKVEGEKVFILLNIPSKQELTYDDFHNVYCYSIDGAKIWQIGIRPKGDKAVYTMINLDDSFLYANDFLGRRYYVDKNTGNIRDMKIVK